MVLLCIEDQKKRVNKHKMTKAFSLFCSLFFSISLFGQIQFPKQASPIFSLKKTSSIYWQSISSPTHSDGYSKTIQPSCIQLEPAKELGVFCKLELKMEQKNGLPFKFRLGEVQQQIRSEYGEFYDLRKRN